MSTPLQHRARAANDLGFRLLSHLTNQKGETGENVFLSSMSVAIALAMTYNGASGGAREALHTILGVGESSLEDLNNANAALIDSLSALDPKVTIAIANSIWAAAGHTPAPEFARRIADQYAGKVANVDFSASEEAARVINEWVAKNTHGKISDLLTAGNVRNALLILVNAIYFKGTWTTPFDKDRTFEAPFTCGDGSQKPMPMMQQSGKWHYSDTEMFQGIVLPYGEGRVSMHVLLPKPHVSLAAFREYLTSERWHDWPRHAHQRRGSILLPRFKARSSKDLVDALAAIGGRGFTGPSFQEMGVGDLVIASVIHAAVLEVNEEGAEAAAATAVVMERSLPQNHFDMVVDRPFFFAICDQETGAILFSGWILNPE
jgi:serpin B